MTCWALTGVTVLLVLKNSRAEGQRSIVAGWLVNPNIGCSSGSGSWGVAAGVTFSAVPPDVLRGMSGGISQAGVSAPDVREPPGDR